MRNKCRYSYLRWSSPATWVEIGTDEIRKPRPARHRLQDSRPYTPGPMARIPGEPECTRETLVRSVQPDLPIELVHPASSHSGHGNTPKRYAGPRAHVTHRRV